MTKKCTQHSYPFKDFNMYLKMDNSHHSYATVSLLSVRIIHYFPIKHLHAYKSHYSSSCDKRTHGRNTPSSKEGKIERL